MGVEELEAIVAPLGRPLVQRSTLYGAGRARGTVIDGPGRTGAPAAPSTTLASPVTTCSRRRQSRGELQDSMIGSLGDLAREGTSVGDLKIANAALAEMAEAFRVFRPYRHIRKVTMFGSARTKPDDPIYILARDLAATLAGGRLDGGDRGRSRHHGGRAGGGRARAMPSGSTSGCPSRRGANPFIAQDPKLVEMRYFFTRKLMLIKESHAYAVLPGGLRHPGRGLRAADPAADGQGRAGAGGHARDARAAPTGTRGCASCRTRRSTPGWVSPEDQALFKVTNDARRGRRRDPRLLPELPLHAAGWATCWCSGCSVPPSKAELADLNRRFADIVVPGQHPHRRALPAGAPTTTPSCPGSPSASTASTSPACAS